VAGWSGRLMNGECDEMMLKAVVRPRRAMKTLSISTLCVRSSVVTMKSRGMGARQKSGRWNGSSAGPMGSGVNLLHAQS
jgi:hypothetical protein